MSERALLVIQMQNARDDRVSRWLKRAGYELDYRLVANGDSLPDPAEDYAIAVVYGGPQSANDSDSKPYIADQLEFIRGWSDRGKPLLGLCLGAQLLAKAYGGEVTHHPEGLNEIGYAPIEPTEPGRELFSEPMHVYHWHTEGFEVPAEGELLARGQVFPNQAFRIGAHAYGLQFHPETTVPIFSSWMTEAGHMLSLPGAQPREAQFRDALKHDDRLADWLDGFLAGFLGRSADKSENG